MTGDDPSPVRRPRHWLPVACLVASCALWGVSFPVIKALHLDQGARLPGASTAFLAAWMQSARFLLGALVLAPLLVRARPTARELRQGAWLALWGGLGMGLQADGLAHTAASTSAFLTQAYCVFLPLLACLRQRRPPDARTVGATALVVVGCAILSGVRPGDLRLGRGEAETLLAAVLFTFQILVLQEDRFAGNRGVPVTFAMCAGIALLGIPALCFTAPSLAAMVDAGASWPTAGMIGALAVGCSVGAFLLMNTWQRHVSAVEAGLIYTTEPVFAAAYALFLPAWLGHWIGHAYPDESLTLTLMIGGALIIGANVLTQWPASDRATAGTGAGP